MAVIETKKQERDIRAVIFIAALVVGFLMLAGVIWWLVKPSAPRQIKLTGEQAKQAQASYTPPASMLPQAAPIPQAQDPGPTLITLDLKQVTPHEALEAMAKQAKVDLHLPQQRGRGGVGGFLQAMMGQRIDVAIKNEPFWPAFLKVCKQANLYPYAEWNQPTRMSLRQGGGPDFEKLPHADIGSCMVVLQNVVSYINADLVGPRAPDRSLNVSMLLYVEPKLSPYRISTVATLETAVDENGLNLIRPRQQWDDRQGGGPQSVWTRDVTCNLLFPPNAGGRIAKLKGYVSVALAGPDQTERIDNPLAATNVDVKIENTLVRLVALSRSGSHYTARMAGDINSPIFKEWDRFSKIGTLVDRNGKEFDRSGGGWGGGRGTTMDFQLSFTAPPDASEPAELRITLPTQLRELRVPFEFDDLPLPH